MSLDKEACLAEKHRLGTASKKVIKKPKKFGKSLLMLKLPKCSFLWHDRFKTLL